MRIILEVEGGEVTFTVRQSGQVTSGTGSAGLGRTGTGGATDAGPAALVPRTRPPDSSGRETTTISGAGLMVGQDAGPAPRFLASRRERASSPASMNQPAGPSQGIMKTATNAGPAPRHPTATQVASPANLTGESFNLIGGTGRDAGPAPALHPRRRATSSNGGKSK